MLKPSHALAALFVHTAILSGAGPAFASSTEKPSVAGSAMSANHQPTDFSSSWRGRRNTAIALGAAAGILGGLAIGAGGYPFYPYTYYGPAYPAYGYYGPTYPYYGPPVVYVRPRKVRCLAYDPYRGIRFWTVCYR